MELLTEKSPFYTVESSNGVQSTKSTTESEWPERVSPGVAIGAKAADMGGKDNLELGSPMGYSPSMTSDWRYGITSLTDSSVGLVPLLNSVAVNKEDFPGSSYASASMDSFGATVWDHPMNPQNLGFGDINVHNQANSSVMIGIRKSGPPSLRTSNDRTQEMGWSPTSSLLNGSIMLPTRSGMLPQSLSQSPTDSAFIERAARFSCFSGGNYGDVVNPFGIPQPLSISHRTIGFMHGSQELAGDNLKPACEGQPQKKNTNVDSAAKDASLSMEHQSAGGSPLKTDRRSESLVRSNDGEKQGVDGSGNESDEAEFSGGVNGETDSSMLEGTGFEHSTKLNNPKKRKRVGQTCEKNQLHGTPQHQIEAPKANPENQQKGNQKAASTSNKTTVKQGKQGSQASDNPKEEYIHVRARRGQATNSHSLAERVRREKISERMKFLQDIVPGCSKVTGKAVMLDEIINDVQSLQRQVEFLSMKLATVNPRMDFDIEELLAKDVIQQRAGTSAIGLSSHDNNMIYPRVYPSHSVMVQEGIPVIANSSDMLGRTFLPKLAPLAGGYKEHTQLADAWNDELHNIVQMSYGLTLPLHGSVPEDRMKVEI